MTNREQKLLPSARQLTSVRRTSNLNSLTGLPERLDFLRQVQQLLTEKKLNGWCVLSIDIEHFKLFNNWYGQVQGDELLHTIGHQLAQLAKENDYIAGYFGGDDFFLIVRFEPTQNIRRVHAAAHNVGRHQGRVVSGLYQRDEVNCP